MRPLPSRAASPSPAACLRVGTRSICTCLLPGMPARACMVSVAIETWKSRAVLHRCKDNKRAKTLGMAWHGEAW